MTYVVIQFSILLFMIVSTNWDNFGILSLIMIMLSVSLGLWAILTVGVYNVRILPELNKGADLVTHGPYRLVRHPMYLSLIILCAGLIISTQTWYMFLGGAFLLVVLVLKLQYEEKKLVAEFPKYKEYKSETYYLIPFIY